jgi:Flavin-binding monooxygenase-like
LKYSGKEKFDDVKYGMYRRFISLAAPHSLAFVGAILAPSLLPTICEIQAQYLVRLWNGEITLPPSSVMKEEVDKHAELVEKTRYHKDDVSYVQFVPYLDGLAKQVGCDVLSRLTWGLWWRDRKLYNYIKKGPFSGHQYRYLRSTMYLTVDSGDVGHGTEQGKHWRK